MNKMEGAYFFADLSQTSFLQGSFSWVIFVEVMFVDVLFIMNGSLSSVNFLIVCLSFTITYEVFYHLVVWPCLRLTSDMIQFRC